MPAGRWGATWLVALVLAIAGTLGLEKLTRATGQRPSVVDDPLLWSLARHDATGDRTVAFLGASRMALGFEPDTFAAAAPGYRAVNLSISDHLPGGVLADLAADPAFRGTVVIDLIETEIEDRLLLHDTEAYTDRAHALWRAPGALINRVLASYAQSHLAVLAVGGRRIVTTVAAKRSWPAAAWVAIEPDRTSRGDYSLATPAALRQKADRRVSRPPVPKPPAEWLAILERDLEPLVAAIRARGGEVVVVKMPISGKLAAMIDELYPRAQYWDAFAARTKAHVLHFRDIPGMAHLTCPDEMHLDQRDQATFMRALVEAMRARGLLR